MSLYDQLGDKEKSKEQFDSAKSGFTRTMSARLDHIVKLNSDAFAGLAPPNAPPPPDAEPVVQVQRYATVKGPPLAEAGQEIEISAALTEQNQTPAVSVFPYEANLVNGQLVLSLKAADATPTWSIDVLLSAPSFEVVEGATQQKISLPRNGDSDSAVFKLRLKPEAAALPLVRVSVTFAHKGVLLASAMLDITVKSREPTPVISNPPVADAASNRMSVLATVNDEPVDLDLRFEDFPGGGCSLIILTPYVLDQQASVPCKPTADVSDWLAGKLKELLETAGISRTFKALDDAPAAPVEKVKVLAQFNGFGKELYDYIAPQQLKTTISDIHNLGKPLKRVMIRASNPAIPWELMILDDRQAPNGLGFLGTEAEVGRLHLAKTAGNVPAPPNQVIVQKVASIAPHYEGELLLANQTTEVASIMPMHGFYEVAGTYEGMSQLLSNPPDGIIHFAGHGLVDTVQGASRFIIQLEQGAKFGLTDLSGLVKRGGQTHSLYFLNACDVGEAKQVSDFVEGWGPEVLKDGGSGFIGGMWPVSDAAASDFAATFYKNLRDGSKNGGVEVAELMRLARRKFADTGDPTYIGYVFYGDVRLKLVP